MKQQVIDFTPGGVVESMHNDKFNLGFLGPQEITRASDIRFDAYAQSWTIFLNTGHGSFVPSENGFQTYEAARQFEVEWLNECRLQSIAPSTWEGKQIANALRIIW